MADVGRDLLSLACTGDVLHLGTVHDPQISRGLEGARRLALTVGRRGEVCRLGRVALGLFWYLLLNAERYKLLLLL